jgi:rod shape-determining protein MreC
MESVLGRYRNLVILVGVLFLQVLGLAMQVKRSNTEAQDTRLIRIWAVGAITPFERGLIWVERGSGNLWHNYFYLRGVRAENRQLKAEIEQMRLEQVRLGEDAAQARRLQTLLAFKEQFISRTVAAQVIGASGSDLSRVVYIDKGENAGLRRDMAVITSDGIVGKTLTVYPNVSQVLLINDQSSGVGAILENTRLQGVLRGTTNGEVVLERVMSDEQVPVGETLLTSGGDQIFPKGLPVGTVTKVGSGKDLFLNIKVKPAANLSKLEEVLVLVEKQERQATAEDSVHVRAADILAQRLPSVPDKPVTPATSVVPGAAAATGGTAAAAPNGAAKAQTPTKVEAKPQTPSATPKVAGNTGPGIQPMGVPAGAAPTASQKKTSAATGGTAPSTSEPSQTKPPSRPKPNSVSPPKPVPAQTNPQPPADPGTPQ